MATIIPNN